MWIFINLLWENVSFEPYVRLALNLFHFPQFFFFFFVSFIGCSRMIVFFAVRCLLTLVCVRGALVFVNVRVNENSWHPNLYWVEHVSEGTAANEYEIHFFWFWIEGETAQKKILAFVSWRWHLPAMMTNEMKTSIRVINNRHISCVTHDDGLLDAAPYIFLIERTQCVAWQIQIWTMRLATQCRCWLVLARTSQKRHVIHVCMLKFCVIYCLVLLLCVDFETHT